MTIKTLKQATSTSCSLSSAQSKNTSSDMPRGAVRNLFGTAVDRSELKNQMQSMESKSKRELSKYKLDSVIGVIKRNDEDQQRRLKYLPSASTKKEDTRRSFSASHTLHSMMLESSSSSVSYTATTASSYKTAESKISTATKAINNTLPKGQKTIKDYYPTVKKSRQNQR